MVQKNGVLTREDNRVSPSSARRVAVRQHCPAYREREIPVDMAEQTWILEAGEEICVGRTTPKPLNTLVKIIRWLKHLGAGKVDDRHLESRHNIRQNFRAKGIGL